MADDKKPEGKGISSAIPITMVLAILAGFIAKQPLPYRDERPASRTMQVYYADAQDVDARLWQDPFTAVDAANTDKPPEISPPSSGSKPAAKPPTTHTSQQVYYNTRFTKADHVTVLAVTLPGGPYQEAAEARMRRRYAVLSGLANQEYTPVDEQHIGYFYPDQAANLQRKIPFEWWSFNKPGTTVQNKVLVLWVDELSLDKCPAAKLGEVLRQASAHGKVMTDFDYAVIGPNTSTLLLDMLKEGTSEANACVGLPQTSPQPKSLGNIDGHTIAFYAAAATASDARLLEFGLSPHFSDVSSALQQKGITLLRTTATDTDMMRILDDELQLRHLSHQKQVVILSEWDTFYGQSMPLAFQEFWGPDGKNTHTFSYMRGLDGKLPDKADKSANSNDKKTDSNDKASANAVIEFPEGQSQKDYLRRLAGELNGLDQEIQTTDPDGIAAIGILGSDVHDILMILEALRQYFPHKLFFTTNLNAAFIHPSKLPQTHNLLVASAYDLKLRPELQGKIPAFRDSYQSAFFATTQMLLTDGLAAQIGKPAPRLFETGLKQFIALPTKQDKLLPTDTRYQARLNSACDWQHWDACQGLLHPQLFVSLQLQENWGGAFFFEAITVILASMISWRARNSLLTNWRILLPLGIILPVVFNLSVGLWNSYNSQTYAEPFFWLEGVSAWPSQLLWILASLSAFSFFIWGYNRISAMQHNLQIPTNQLATTFALPESPSIPCWLKMLFIGSWEQNNPSNTVSPATLWQEYLGYSDRYKSKRYCLVSFLRIFIRYLIFLSIVYAVIQWGGLPNIPIRGENALLLYLAILVVASTCTFMLTIWVVENARLCGQLITHLSAQASDWHQEAQDWAKDTKKVAPECVNEWLDIKLVETLTETIQPLIWGTFVCITLLALARSPAIDDWDMPCGLLMVMVALLVYAFSAEIFLQNGAKRARIKATTSLTYKISAERNKPHPDDVVIKRIETEIDRIAALRKGAFRPWYELPLLQSFGGVGTFLVAIQYFIGVWESGTF